MAKKKYYETEDFKALQAQWYDKIKPTFTDIENGSDDPIVRKEIIKIDTSTRNAWTDVDYAELCRKILQDFNFKRDLDRLVFELHSNGMSVRDIEEYVSRNSLRKLTKSSIDRLIKRIKEDYLRGVST